MRLPIKPIAALLVLSTAALAVHASPRSELPGLIACHEALDGRSDGESNKLHIGNPTPIALPSKGKIYFYTHNKSGYSTSVLDGKTYLGKKIVLKVQDEDKPFYQSISIDTDKNPNHKPAYPVIGGNGEPTPEEMKAGTVTPSDLLTNDVVQAMKDEVLLRWKNLEYAFDSDHLDGTAKAFLACRQVESDPLQKQLDQVRKQKAVLNKKLNQMEKDSKNVPNPNSPNPGKK